MRDVPSVALAIDETLRLPRFRADAFEGSPPQREERCSNDGVLHAR
jgi:hypothetical protein